MPKIIAYEVKLNGIETAVTNSQQLNDAIKATRKELNGQEFGGASYRELNKQLANLKNTQQSVTAETRQLQKELIATGQAGTGSYRAMAAELSSLNNKYKDLTATERASPLGGATLKSIQNLQTELKGIDAAMGNYQRNVGNYKSAWLNTLTGIAPQTSQFFTQTTNAAGVAAAGFNTLGAAAAGVGIAVAVIGKALAVNAKVSDLKADVSKTADLTKTEIDGLVESLKTLDTRTSIDNLLKIGAIGGQLGVSGKAGIEAFTKSVDKLSVALSDEFTGGASQVADEVGKLSNVLFGVTKDGDKLATNILNIGNALNVLSSEGAATAPVIADFASRIGRIAIPLGLTQGQVLGLSSTLQELNVNAEQGGTAVNRLLGALSSDRANVAKVLGLDLGDFTKLLNTDLNAALNLVIGRVGELGKTNTDLSDILKTLKIDGQGELSVFLALAENQDLLKTRTDQASKSLTNQNSILSEFNVKNTTLQGSLDKLKNSLENAFVGGRVESGLTSLVNLVSSLFNGIGRVGDGLDSVVDKIVKATAFLDFLRADADKSTNGKTFQGSKQSIFDLTKNTNILGQIAPQQNVIGVQNPFAGINEGVPFLSPTQSVRTTKPQIGKAGKAAKADPSVKAAQDISDELLRIEEARKVAIEKIQKEQREARAKAIEDDEQREKAQEEARFTERFLAIRERGQAIEDDANEKAAKLKGREGVNQAQINKIIAEGKAARLEVERESNTLIASEFDEHRKKLSDIEQKYNEKTIKAIEAAQKERGSILFKSLNEQFTTIDENTPDNKLSNLNQKRETLQNTLRGAIISNALAKTSNQSDIFNADDLLKLRNQIIGVEKDITKATDEESKKRKKLSDEEKKKRKDDNKDIARAAIDGAQTVLNSVSELQAANSRAETDAKLRELDKQYSARLKAAQGNSIEEEKIQKELDEKKRAIQREAIAREAQAAKLQAIINGAISITKTFAQFGFTPAGIIASVASGIATGFQVAVIDKNAKAQIAALAARGGAFETSYLQGNRHGHGGTQLGNVEAERGEAVMVDEFNRTIVVNRNSAAAFRSQIEAMQGRVYSGKAAQLSYINSYNGYGKKLALGGAIVPNYTPVLAANSNNVQYIVTSSTIDKASMNELVERVSVSIREGAKDGAAVGTYQGTVTGVNESNRIAERQAALQSKTNR